ncbi:MAG TPA: EF-hand domain-containing protein [Qipengyuania sp.]|nr:EF-hand domain-containing protein [Qipengyuania sp.]
MNRTILGALGTLLLVGIGLFWWQGRAEVERGAPPPQPPTASPAATDIPTADGAGLTGPAPPEATELTREQQRFGRYDRDRSGRIGRNEMLSTRTEAFRKLDKDGNNLLTFEEWAVATVNRFEAADRDRDAELTPEEFAATKPKRSARPACRC